METPNPPAPISQCEPVQQDGKFYIVHPEYANPLPITEKQYNQMTAKS